ncbi:MAG: hypothetical protein H6661_08915 [Ardenticatenaceae bacterium]|nr:hypothetical protein [Ardenticatenaceae bacterium]
MTRAEKARQILGIAMGDLCEARPRRETWLNLLGGETDPAQTRFADLGGMRVTLARLFSGWGVLAGRSTCWMQ